VSVWPCGRPGPPGGNHGGHRRDGQGGEVRYGRLPWRRAAIMAHLAEQQRQAALKLPPTWAELRRLVKSH